MNGNHFFDPEILLSLNLSPTCQCYEDMLLNEELNILAVIAMLFHEWKPFL